MKVWRSRYYWTRCLCQKEKKVTLVSMSTLERKKQRKKAVYLLTRYVLQGSRWRVTDLTYRVTKYPTTTRLKKSEVGAQTKNRNMLHSLNLADRQDHEAGFWYVGGSH